MFFSAHSASLRENLERGNEGFHAVTLLRYGEVVAVGVLRGSGVGVLEEAVGVGGGLAEVLPGLQIGGGLDVNVLAR
jgi:hypothetical protein